MSTLRGCGDAVNCGWTGLLAASVKMGKTHALLFQKKITRAQSHKNVVRKKKSELFCLGFLLGAIDRNIEPVSTWTKNGLLPGLFRMKTHRIGQTNSGSQYHSRRALCHSCRRGCSTFYKDRLCMWLDRRHR